MEHTRSKTGARPAAGSRNSAAPLLCGLVLFGACGGGASPAPVAGPGPESRSAGERANVRAEGPLVVFLGDSLSAGLHLDPNEAFPAVLGENLAARGLPIRVVNAGVSGDTAAGGRRRIEWLLRQEPDVVVVQLGTNDGLRGTPLDSIEENLGAIVERARAAGARVLLLGLDIPPSYGAEYARGFRELYARVAERNGVPLVPSFLAGVGGVPELNLEDGLHPTAAGQRRLAENVEPYLAAVLGELGAPE